MDALNSFIFEMNGWREFEKKPMIKFPLNQEEINDIADTVDCRLSPENLHCDGEISNSEANSKWNYLQKVFADLKVHAKAQGLGITVKTYEID